MPRFLPQSKLDLAFMARFPAMRTGNKVIIGRMSVIVDFEQEDLEVVKQWNRILAYDTGRMTEGWFIAGNYIINPVPYSGFVNYGTIFMAPRRVLENAIPEISRKYSKRLRQQIKVQHFFSPEDLVIRLGGK